MNERIVLASAEAAQTVSVERPTTKGSAFGIGDGICETVRFCPAAWNPTAGAG
jgi:hypothetical protein